MASTYTPIASTTLGSNTANITFSGISGIYTDLIVIALVRSSYAGTAAFGLRLNNDSTSLYSSTRLYSNTGAGTVGADRNAGTYLEIGQMVGSTATSGIFTPQTIHINNYSNSTTYTSIIGESRNNQDAYGVQQMVGLYRSTSAITEVKLYDAYGGNLVTGSIISLYGIKAA